MQTSVQDREFCATPDVRFATKTRSLREARTAPPSLHIPEASPLDGAWPHVEEASSAPTGPRRPWARRDRTSFAIAALLLARSGDRQAAPERLPRTNARFARG